MAEHPHGVFIYSQQRSLVPGKSVLTVGFQAVGAGVPGALPPGAPARPVPWASA